jgi:hypothetical protein
MSVMIDSIAQIRRFIIGWADEGGDAIHLQMILDVANDAYEEGANYWQCCADIGDIVTGWALGAGIPTEAFKAVEANDSLTWADYIVRKLMIIRGITQKVGDNGKGT